MHWSGHESDVQKYRCSACDEHCQLFKQAVSVLPHFQRRIKDSSNNSRICLGARTDSYLLYEVSLHMQRCTEKVQVPISHQMRKGHPLVTMIDCPWCHWLKNTPLAEQNVDRYQKISKAKPWHLRDVWFKNSSAAKRWQSRILGNSESSSEAG